MKTYLLLFLSVVLLTSCDSDDSDVVIDEGKGVIVDKDDDDGIDEDKDLKTYSGDFVSVDHPTSGVASVNKEHTLLNLTNFKSDNGPDLDLYLATDASGADFINLGDLKGLDGDYEYTLSDDIDFSVYKYVIVWCVDFDVNFGQALLEED